MFLNDSYRCVCIIMDVWKSRDVSMRSGALSLWSAGHGVLCWRELSWDVDENGNVWPSLMLGGNAPYFRGAFR